MEFLGFTQARERVGNKKEYYEALERNGFKMPAYKGQFVTSDVLIKIRNGEMYCPRYTDLVVRPCPTPPDAMTIKNELINGIHHSFANGMDNSHRPRFDELLKQLERATPDKDWMLQILSIMTQGQHQYFSKSYVPPPKVRNQNDSYLHVENRDGFFNDLPQSRVKGNVSTMILTPLQREEQKCKRIE
jgi:hypothetical protein